MLNKSSANDMRLSIIKTTISEDKSAQYKLAEGTRVYEAKGFVAGMIPVNVVIFDYKSKQSRVDCYNVEHHYKAKDLVDVAEVSVKTTMHCLNGYEFDVNHIYVRHSFTSILRRVINEYNLDLPFCKEYEDAHGCIWRNVYAKNKRREDVLAETILDKRLREIVQTGDFNDFLDHE